MKKIALLVVLCMVTVTAQACPLCLGGWLATHTTVIAEVGTVAYAGNQVITLVTTAEKDIAPIIKSEINPQQVIIVPVSAPIITESVK